MNFVFTDGTSSYIGTAGHCVAGGRTMIAQVATRVDPTDTVLVLVEQGYAKFGEVVPDLTLLFPFTSPNGFNWVGYGLPGDSGSGVMNDAGLAVGDLTHGIAVSGVPVPGLNFGTDMQQIFNLIGGNYSLVTVDGRRATCAKPLGI